MHHGAGSSGLTFASCVEEIRKILPKAGFLSPDCREHGSTTVKRKGDEGEVDPDLRLETLSQDLVFVIHEAKEKMGWASLPDIVLVGHSLGGAVVTDVAKKGELGAKLLAYAVLDVVEGMLYIPHHTIHSQLFSVNWLMNHDRLGNGRSPKHGQIPLHPSNSVPLPDIWNRMAVRSSPPKPSFNN